MCEIKTTQRGSYQDPPKILPESLDQSSEFLKKHQEYMLRREEQALEVATRDSSTVSNGQTGVGTVSVRNNCQRKQEEEEEEEEKKQVPSSLTINDSSSSSSNSEVITNGVKRDPDSCDSLTNGREMAPVMGVPPPPPAPLMSPDGLILPRKPYNPCLISNNHRDLRRELLFNQKVGKNVLNQKSELQRVMERQREAKSRREAEKNREEFYKDDPRTALQRALEQRAKQLEMLEQPPIVEPPNPLVTARAKLRTRTDSQ